MILLAAPKKRTSELTDEITGATTAMAATTMRLLSTTKQRPKLTNKIARAAASVTTVVLLASTHKRVHSETPKSACPIARWAIAHAARTIADVRAL